LKLASTFAPVALGTNGAVQPCMGSANEGWLVADSIGWASSIVLVITLFVQVRKQWQDDTSRGVSPFLFIGQLAASLGFLAYSVVIENWVFVVTNILTSTAAVLGLGITWRHRQRTARKSQSLVRHMEHT
jgi:uncharacterized protein with PQ loop repeat